mgnify:FL=1
MHNKYIQAYKGMNDGYLYALKHPNRSSNYVVHHYAFPKIIQRIKNMEQKICIYGYIYGEKTNNGWKITK